MDSSQELDESLPFNLAAVSSVDLELLDQIPEHIWNQVAQLDLRFAKENQNQEILDLLSRTTLLGGKRFRPLLSFLMADFFNVPFQVMTPYARGIELVHAASLAHDDVIDEATTRRGVESINVAATNKKAVLAGDYLLADVIVEMCRLGNLRLVSELSMVIKDLSDGEWLQMESQKLSNVRWDYIEQVARKKTASVMSWCCVAPAILAKASDQVVEDCRNFGMNLGLAFQFIDDTLDFLHGTGKDGFQDLKNGIINAVTFEYLKEHPQFSRLSTLADLEGLLSPLSPDMFIPAAEKVRIKAGLKLKEAKNLLAKIRQDHSFFHPAQTDEAMGPIHFVLNYLAKRRK